jgi:bacterioferritin-associated ferredoxin
MYICVCKAVTDSQIRTAIEQGMCTRKKLTHCFGLGKDCGKCNQEVNALLEQKLISIQESSCPSYQPDDLPLNSLFDNKLAQYSQKQFNVMDTEPHSCFPVGCVPTH